MKNTVKAADGKCCGKHPDWEGNAWIVPATVRVQGLEDEWGRTVLRQCGKRSNDGNKKYDMEDAPNGFKVVD